MGSFFYLYNILDACDLSFLLTVSIFFFAIGGVMTYFNILCFVPMSLIPYLTIFSIVVTNDFLEDMISVLDLFYPVYHKTKVIILEISISV